MEIIHKNFDDISFSDIDFLIQSKIHENNYLEYKGNQFLNAKKPSDEVIKDKINLLQKIGGLSNNRGGLIIIGLDEDDGKNPIFRSSPNIIDFEHLIHRLVMDGLQPVLNIEIKKVENSAGDFLYLIKVPESKTPVMVYWKGNKEGIFPIRIGEETKIATLNDVDLLCSRGLISIA